MTDRYSEVIGEIIRETRHRHEMTQAELGNAVGVSSLTVLSWENAHSRITLTMFMRVCLEGLGESPDDILRLVQHSILIEADEEY